MVLCLLIFEALQHENENPLKSMFTEQVDRKHDFIGPKTRLRLVLAVSYSTQ